MAAPSQYFFHETLIVHKSVCLSLPCCQRVTKLKKLLLQSHLCIYLGGSSNKRRFVNLVTLWQYGRLLNHGRLGYLHKVLYFFSNDLCQAGGHDLDELLPERVLKNTALERYFGRAARIDNWESD